MASRKTASSKTSAKTSAKTSTPAPPKKLRALLAAANAGDWRAARPLASTLLKAAPTDPNVLTAAAYVSLHGGNDAGRAKRLAEKALEASPTRDDALSVLQGAALALGDAAGTAEAAERRIALNPTNGALYYALAVADPERAATYDDAMSRGAASEATPADARAGMFAALGRIRERAGDDVAAFEAYAMSKRLTNRPYDGATLERLLQLSVERFDAAHFDRRRSDGRDDERMVFVLGMPRTGSTLVERILAAHGDVDACGETAAFAEALTIAGRVSTPGGAGRYNLDALATAPSDRLRKAGKAYLDGVRPLLRRPSAARWIEKMPGNFIHCGAIATVFPRAKIVMTERNPRDVFVSCLRILFETGHGFTEAFDRFAHYYAMQRAFAAHWRSVLGDRLLEIRYEDLASDVDAVARRLTAHAGLTWDDACARPHEAPGAVKTSSAFQVRAPTHTKSIGAWRRYEAQLAPLLEMLDAIEAQFAAKAAA